MAYASRANPAPAHASALKYHSGRNTDMFHAIAVDDESAALKRFERIASEDSRISIEGAFLYAEDSIEFVKKHLVDVAFLDIEMPEMNGLELAERLMEIIPYIRVIFVTAYNQYALDAFRAHAIGYLLKPLDREEFTEQIDLLVKRYRSKPSDQSKKRLKVRCFGQFYIGPDEESTSAIRWKTAKAEELFALLIHYQGRVKSKESIIDILWPELEPEKSANLFRVTCTYLRTALAEMGFSDLLMRELDGYRINADLIDCDLFRFRLAARSGLSLKSDKLEEASVLYSGEYLEGKPYDWAIGARIQLETAYKNIQYQLADGYSINGYDEKACEALEKILRYDPCEEEAVTRIIQMKLQEGDHTSAVKVFKRYVKILKDELGILPSEKLMKLLPKDSIEW
jgi:two-component system, LytTR family, response regulator